MRGGSSRETRVGQASSSLDTIVAVATPPGIGGVAIIRMSGPLAEPILRAVFRPRRSRARWETHRMILGLMVSPGEVPVDEGLAVVMRAPRSYTGEDVAELHVHGGDVVSREVVNLCVAQGARLAQPGEFTLRAFLNGRLDLAQAESVLQVVQARTAAGLRLAVDGLRGRLSRRLDQVRERLLGLASRLEAELDFGDEVPETPREEIEIAIEWSRSEVTELLSGAQAGRLVSDGIRTVIVGPPNAGKSTLLNALLGEERALVSPYPGTTRDRLDESTVVEGVLLRVIDTAGIRSGPTDPVEQMGIGLSRRAAAEAEVLVLVLDGSAGPPEDWEELRALCLEKDCVVVLNKRDLGSRLGLEEVRGELPRASVVEASLLVEDQRERVIQAISSVARIPAGDRSGLFSLTQRQYAALARSRGYLERVLDATREGLSTEFLCADLRPAILALGEIQGIDVSEEILDRIFSTFCLGK